MFFIGKCAYMQSMKGRNDVESTGGNSVIFILLNAFIYSVLRKVQYLLYTII